MKKEFFYRIVSSIILTIFSFFFIIKGSFLFIFFIVVCFLIAFYEWHMMSQKKNYHIPGFIFLIFSFISVIALRNSNVENNLFLFFIILLICIFTDIGGYIFGKLFKGPKLTKISPKKTYSGMIGGYIFSIVGISIIVNYSGFFSIVSDDISIKFKFLAIIFLISSVSQAGDIIMSYFKRLSKIKDTGKLIPGHGGILDRIDGMIFAFPFSYLISSYLF